MKLLNLFKRKQETRSIGTPPYDTYFIDWHNAQGTSTGDAYSLSTVFACVAVISEGLASLPIHVFKSTAKGEKKAISDPLYTLLHDSPNDFQTSVEFVEYMTTAMLLHGNAYARIERDPQTMAITALIPLNPSKVFPLMVDGVLKGFKVGSKTFLPFELFHLKHRASPENPYLGTSPIQEARQVAEVALKERNHGLNTYSNGIQLNGVLKYPGQLTPEQVASLSNSWRKNHTGSNAGGIAVLEAGMEFQALSMTMKDAEYIESKRFSVEEIARIFKVPPPLIGDLREANYSNAVEMSKWFIQYTLHRHITAWEQAINRQLIRNGRLYAKFNVEGFLRGNSAERASFYNAGIQGGWLTVDEVREKENLPKAEPQASTAPTQGADHD